VQGARFIVPAGRVLGIVGGPGAGKSRLLRCVGLDYPPTRGAVFLRGEEVTGATPERRRRIRGARIELVHPPAPTGKPDPAVPSGRSSVLLGAARPSTVPVAGMRQRIQIAKALTNRAEVLLLDEPLAGVEPVVQGRILELLARLRAEVGTAVVLATRSTELCEALADDMMRMDDGVLAEHQSPDIGFGTPPDDPITGLPTDHPRSA
jgi:ABC-type glutathione transport system ATPase component